MKLPQQAKKALETTVKVGAYAALGSAGSALAWIAVSSLLIDHRRRLGPAIPDCEIERFNGTAGNIAFYASPQGEGLPLVLIHSVNAAASAIEMRPLFQRRRGSRPVYAIDLPGFGLSERRDRQYSPELYVSTLIEWLERVGGPVDAVALSLSCEFAAIAAMRRPDLFHSLAMISPTGFGGKPLSQSELRRKSLSVPFWSQAFFDLLASRASIRYYLAKSFKGATPQTLVDYGVDTAHQPGARFAPLYFLSGELFTPDVMEKVYAPLQLPVTVIYDRDGYVTFENLEPFTSAHPNWKAVRIPDTCGMPQWEREIETINALESTKMW